MVFMALAGRSAPTARFILSCLSMLIILASCSDEEPTVVDRVPISDQVLTVAADLASLRAQLDAVTADCLSEQGFPYFGKTGREHFESLLDLFSLRVLMVSAEEARLEGYGAAPTGASAAITEAQGYFEGLTQAEQDAYSLAHLGTQAERAEYTSPSGNRGSLAVGGCVGVAAQSMYGSVDTYIEAEGIFEDLQFMGGEVLGRAEQRDDVQRAFGDWSDCMQAEGHDFDAPVQAREAALATRQRASDADVGTVTPDEISIAVADAGCQAAVSLNQSYSEAVLEEQQSLTNDRERLFLAWGELMQRVADEGYGDVRTDRDQLLPGASESGG